MNAAAFIFYQVCTINYQQLVCFYYTFLFFIVDSLRSIFEASIVAFLSIATATSLCLFNFFEASTSELRAMISSSLVRIAAAVSFPMVLCIASSAFLMCDCSAIVSRFASRRRASSAASISIFCILIARVSDFSVRSSSARCAFAALYSPRRDAASPSSTTAFFSFVIIFILNVVLVLITSVRKRSISLSLAAISFSMSAFTESKVCSSASTSRRARASSSASARSRRDLSVSALSF
mmetsp:Transcript_8472/g.28389  ORF Transcript_8472/g.28389 Transcript_8472/m.28389 type:complete len:237 (+) Transcript_8472:3505-4215(+)